MRMFGDELRGWLESPIGRTREDVLANYLPMVRTRLNQESGRWNKLVNKLQSDLWSTDGRTFEMLDVFEDAGLVKPERRTVEVNSRQARFPTDKASILKRMTMMEATAPGYKCHRIILEIGIELLEDLLTFRVFGRILLYPFGGGAETLWSEYFDMEAESELVKTRIQDLLEELRSNLPGGLDRLLELL